MQIIVRKVPCLYVANLANMPGWPSGAAVIFLSYSLYSTMRCQNPPAAGYHIKTDVYVLEALRHAATAVYESFPVIRQ